MWSPRGPRMPPRRLTATCSGWPRFALFFHPRAASAAPMRGRNGRNEMQALIDAETPSGDRRADDIGGLSTAKLITAFSRPTAAARLPPRSRSAAISRKARRSRATSPRATPIELWARATDFSTSTRTPQTPKPGITRSIQYAPQKLDLPTIPTEDELTWCIGRRLRAQQPDEARAQRRADAPGQFVLGRHRRMIELLQRILDRAGNPRLGVCQRSVEVEIDRVHDLVRVARGEIARDL